VAESVAHAHSHMDHKKLEPAGESYVYFFFLVHAYKHFKSLDRLAKASRVRVAVFITCLHLMEETSEEAHRSPYVYSTVCFVFVISSAAGAREDLVYPFIGEQLIRDLNRCLVDQ
jgi:hypothetical protein